MAPRILSWLILASLACSSPEKPRLPSEEQVLHDASAEWLGNVGITGLKLEWIRPEPGDSAVAQARLKLEGPMVHELARLHLTYARVGAGWRVTRERIRELRD